MNTERTEARKDGANNESKLTFLASLKSALLAHMTNIKYIPNTDITNAKTVKFSLRLVKPLNADPKSIGFGATKKPPPNDVK